MWRARCYREATAESVSFLCKTTHFPVVCATHGGLFWYLIARNGFPHAMPICLGSDDAATAGRQLMLAQPCLSSYVPGPSATSLTSLNSSAYQGVSIALFSDDGIYAYVCVKATHTYKLHTYVHTGTHTHENRPMKVLGLNTDNLLLKLDSYLVINLNLNN